MKIDWQNLGFNYMPLNSHIRYTHEDDKWNKGSLFKEPYLTLPIAATCFHYGQAAFEGLKAFRCKDGKVRIFRPTANAKRLNVTLNHILAPEIPEEMFIDAIQRVIRDNIEYIPPYGTGGSLYIRPFVIGSGAHIGIAPSKKYEFIVFVVPVGPYYKGGMKPVDALVIEEIDRAAPKGTGHIKVAGNYAAGLKPDKMTKEKNCQVPLFLDSKTHQYIEEFGTSNFFGISKDRKYVTPDSCSILESITNKSLMELAADLGLKVEKRIVPKEELADFAEVGACGTAVVITPVGRIFMGDNVYNYGSEIGEVSKLLYDRITGIQYGEYPDNHNWMMELI